MNAKKKKPIATKKKKAAKNAPEPVKLSWGPVLDSARNCAKDTIAALNSDKPDGIGNALGARGYIHGLYAAAHAVIGVGDVITGLIEAEIGRVDLEFFIYRDRKKAENQSSVVVVEGET